MALDLLKIMKIMFPEASDQEITQELQTIQAETPDISEEDLLAEFLKQIKQD